MQSQKDALSIKVTSDYITFKGAMMADFISSKWLTSHSHTITTFHPADNSLEQFLESLAIIFRSNLFNHHSTLVFGIVARLQPWWRCQKQPWTKITVFHFGRTISGLPGRFLSCNLKRNPLACNIFLTINSGFVFLLRIRLIFLERATLSRWSVKTTSFILHFRTRLIGINGWIIPTF